MRGIIFQRSWTIWTPLKKVEPIATLIIISLIIILNQFLHKNELYIRYTLYYTYISYYKHLIKFPTLWTFKSKLMQRSRVAWLCEETNYLPIQLLTCTENRLASEHIYMYLCERKSTVGPKHTTVDRHM